jgi:hypothetical protein
MQAMPYLNLKGRRTGFSKNSPQKIPFMQKWNFKEMGCGLHHGLYLYVYQGIQRVALDVYS